MTAKKCPVGTKKDPKTGKCTPKSSSGLSQAQMKRVRRELGGQRTSVKWIHKPKITKGRPATRAFSHVQEIELTSPSRKIMITHGNVEMEEPLRTEPYHETDIELLGTQIVKVYTKDKKTRVVLPRNTKCTTRLGSKKMTCKSKGAYGLQATPGGAMLRPKMTPEERIARKRERRRIRRAKRRLERQQARGTVREGGIVI